MKPSIRFISSKFRLGMAIVMDIAFLAIGIFEVIGCFLYPADFPLYLALALVFFSLLAGSLWLFSRRLYMVEVYSDKMKFKGLFHRYTVMFSQIQLIEVRNVPREGKVFFMDVEGYRRADTYKFGYPFQFSSTQKSQQFVESIASQIQ